MKILAVLLLSPFIAMAWMVTALWGFITGLPKKSKGFLAFLFVGLLICFTYGLAKFLVSSLLAIAAFMFIMAVAIGIAINSFIR